jgi:hypothetical protein
MGHMAKATLSVMSCMHILQLARLLAVFGRVIQVVELV